ncbi:hypothetical protein [Anabaena sp. 4-3]|uniref:hypothetical protein n=1 Tax=Anabaena sp. 4-3 TaxID=1811979 RepID=UPI00082AD284|nr:hypothetical protein [Anabaena sp. 4-3]
MIDDLPQLDPLPVIETSDNEEEELFYPQWRCFCCQDSGIIPAHLARLIMPSYHSNRDKWPICQNLNCDAYSKRFGDNVGLENFDTRLIPAICQKLDFKNREFWRITVQKQIEIRSLAKKMKMPGSGDRTENDNREVRQRKAEIEAITPEQWERMRAAYLGGEDD